MASNGGATLGQRFKNTRFQRDWGIHRNDFAEQECVTPDAITMRLRAYGTPWQRRKSPTKFEVRYGRTLYEIAEERDLHPQTIIYHHNEYGDAFYSNTNWHRTKHTVSAPGWRTAVQTGMYWRKQCAIFHPNHPDYEAFRSGTLWDEEYIGGSKLSAEQVEQMMHNAGWDKY